MSAFDTSSFFDSTAGASTAFGSGAGGVECSYRSPDSEAAAASGAAGGFVSSDFRTSAIAIGGGADTPPRWRTSIGDNATINAILAAASPAAHTAGRVVNQRRGRITLPAADA